MMKRFTAVNNSALKVLFAVLILSLSFFVATQAGYAVPGAETQEDAFAEIAERSAEGMAELAAEQEEVRVAAAAEAAASGSASIQAIWINLLETEEGRTAVTLTGIIDPYTPLPIQAMFYFVEDYELGLIEELDFDTGEPLREIEYEVTPSDNEDFENLVIYSFTLHEGHVFQAHFVIDLPLFDHDSEMGDAPLASFNFLPPNDLDGLVVGFTSPSPDRVGAGGQEEIILLDETEDGEIYGIVREGVPGGELQEFLIAFGSREARDEAIAEAEAAAEAVAAANAPWISTPVGMVTVGSAIVLIVAAAAIFVLVARGKNVGAADIQDDDYEADVDDEVDANNEADADDVIVDEDDER
ncbi:MAG: hypothetical protein FWC86_04790 [Coriobacteriia bacterium]|nr:hypothetical protein [Coriobacteriia bacterium]